MNIQLFGYDDGYYYGQCKLMFEAETVADNGKTVTISDGTNTKSAILADKKCEFSVPCRTSWAVTLLDGSTTEWTGRVECGYGDCIHTMLADGYKPVVHNEILTLEQIASQADIDTKVSSASAVKTLNSNLTANSQSFRFAYRNNKYGYFTKEAGTDVFHPFRLGKIHKVKIAGPQSGFNDHNYDPSGAKTATWTYDIKTFIQNNNIDVNYKELDSNNFSCDSGNSAAVQWNSGQSPSAIRWNGANYSYNAESGVLTVTNQYFCGSYGATWGSSDITVYMYWAE